MKSRITYAAILSAALAMPALATTLTPEEVVRVAWDQTGVSDTGSDYRSNPAPTVLSSDEFVARERANDAQTTIQGVTYFKYNLNDITAAAAADPSFSATFSIDYDTVLNSGLGNALGVDVSVVANANTWANSSGSYPLVTWVGGANLGAGISGDHVVLANADAVTPTGQSLTFDATADVKDWVDGTTANNGYVLFGDRDSNQGAGFSNATLKLSSTLALYDFELGTSGGTNSFNHVGNDSVDTNTMSTASRLATTTLDGGGAGNIFNNAAGSDWDDSLLIDSDSGVPVTNWGNGHLSDDGNYASFRVTPDDGNIISYDSISLFHTSFDGSGEFSIRVVEDPDGAEIITDIAVGIANGVNVQFHETDFADFTSNKVTEWRIYIFNAGGSGANTGFRFDDIKLTGFVIVPTPAALPVGLALIGLIAARRRRMK